MLFHIQWSSGWSAQFFLSIGPGVAGCCKDLKSLGRLEEPVVEDKQVSFLNWAAMKTTHVLSSKGVNVWCLRES